MNISAINSSNTNNAKQKNKGDVSFKQIYKVLVNKELFTCPSSPIRSRDEFVSALDIDLLKVKQKMLYNAEQCPLKIFIPVLKKVIDSSLSLSLFFETQKYDTFNYVQKICGYSSGWLVQHLDIKEPTILSDTAYTFNIFTGNDKRKTDRLLTQKNTFKIKKENLEYINENCQKGKYRKSDTKYWKELLYGARLDDMLEKIMKNGNCKKIEINTLEEYENFITKIEESVFEIPQKSG